MKPLPIILLALTLGQSAFAEDGNELYDSVERRDVAEVQRLLERGADVHFAGEAALIAAIQAEEVESVRLLLENRADANGEPGGVPDTALSYALAPERGAQWEKRLTIVRMLLEHGADPNRGAPPALLMLCENAPGIPADVRYGMLRLLLQAGADAKAALPDGKTALMLAVSQQDKELVRKLIQAGADVNAHDKDGTTALMVAVWKNDAAIADLIIEAGADIHAKDNEDHSALWHVDEGQDEIRDLLFHAGADRHDMYVP